MGRGYARLRSYRVFIDGALVGRIAANQTLSFPVTPGEHRLRVKVDWTGSREIGVTVPPDPQLICGGPGQGTFLTFAKPNRTIRLYNAHLPEPRLSPLWSVAGVASWILYVGAFVWLGSRMVAR
jgi:hypothetical protein